MKVGDTIENSRHGVKGTDIPVGAVVIYRTGVDQSPTRFTVVNVPGTGKMLCLGNEPVMSEARSGNPTTNCIHGQNSSMEIVSLPEGVAA